jgi:acyl carrier protein
MDDVQAKLRRCFSAVFPSLSEQEIGQAGLEATEGWDSVATVTLVTVIEEEFGIQLEPSALERFVSFRSILEYLTTLPAHR